MLGSPNLSLLQGHMRTGWSPKVDWCPKVGPLSQACKVHTRLLFLLQICDKFFYYLT